MAEPEESFKVCGLCSQLVDEAVKLTDQLLTFLISFLGVSGSVLPTKICTECYQGANDSKKFKEKCLKTVDKLKKNQISSNMILGRSHTEIRQMKHKYRNSMPESVTQAPPLPPTPQVSRNTPSPGPRSSRQKRLGPKSQVSRRQPSTSSSLEDLPLSSRRVLVPGVDTVPCSIVIPQVEREAADQMVERSRSGRLLKRNVAVLERDASPVARQLPPARQKMPRAKRHSEPLHQIPGPSSKGYGMEEPQEDAPGLDGDDEEIFPSMGPYQCEICQEITDTKQEFVAHIKALHKDMVDEAVLRSLESDLKKRKKKELASAPAPPRNVSAPPRKTPKGEKTPKASKKPAAATPIAPASAPPAVSRREGKLPRARARPIKKYTEVDSEDEYVPSKAKRLKRTAGERGKKDHMSPEELKARNEPGECGICGSRLARSGDIPKHQESLKCRQAAFLASQKKVDDVKVGEENGEKNILEELEGLEDGKEGKEIKEGNEVKELKPFSVINEVKDQLEEKELKKKDVAEEKEFVEEKSDKSDTSETSDTKIKEIIDEKNKSDDEVRSDDDAKSDDNARSDDNERSDHDIKDKDKVSSEEKNHSPIEDSETSKFNFKASIAKRYEAEKNDVSDPVTPGSKKKRDATSFNTVVYAVDDQEFDEEEAIKAAMQESITTAEKELDKEMPGLTNTSAVGEHSPAAYIDPAPQPDVEPSQAGQRSPAIQKPGGNGGGGKPWASSCDSARDAAAEELASMGVRVPPLIPMGHGAPSMDSIDAQMAALHGAAGANTPWHEFHENYFGH